jgi:RNA polymerase sigma factor (TIGR02999 family)
MIAVDVRCPTMNPDIGASPAVASLAATLYTELRRSARGIRAGHRVGDTLQTTALIHEAYLKLARGGGWESRQHFLAAAAMAMRQVVIDAARARQAARRGGGQGTLSLDELDDPQLGSAQDDARIVELGEALEQLAKDQPRWMQVVECRYFAGYTDEETAEALGITDRTARRDWVKARAWLYQALAGEALPEA